MRGDPRPARLAAGRIPGAGDGIALFTGWYNTHDVVGMKSLLIVLVALPSCAFGFYNPSIGRWQTPDPIEEKGGLNLYAFCRNDAVNSADPLGLDRYMTTFSLSPNKDQWHIGIAVDTWEMKECKWLKTGVVTFDYGVDESMLVYRAGAFVGVAKGIITETQGLALNKPFTLPSTPEQDVAMLNMVRADAKNPPLYNFFFNNCIHWATKAIDYGMDK